MNAPDRGCALRGEHSNYVSKFVEQLAGAPIELFTLERHHHLSGGASQ